jgi:hypothetical protein
MDNSYGDEDQQLEPLPKNDFIETSAGHHSCRITSPENNTIKENLKEQQKQRKRMPDNIQDNMQGGQIVSAVSGIQVWLLLH